MRRVHTRDNRHRALVKVVKFWLGSPDVRWLEKTNVPLFYAVAAFKRELPRATAPWALDSGAYTEIAKHGKWRATPKEYVARVREIQEAVGMMEFAAAQDWVAAPPILAKTGLTVTQHQFNTTFNYLDLRDIAPDIPWLPTLQGWSGDDYLSHIEIYEGLGVDLKALPLVGIGSVASRQEDPVVGRVVRHIGASGIKLHGFGVKKQGLKMYGDALASADSQAWSFDARFSFRVNPLTKTQRGGPALDECLEEYLRGEHPPSCSSCMRFALHWREDILKLVYQAESRAAHGSLFKVDHTFRESKKAELNTRQGARKAAASGLRNDSDATPEPERLFDV